MEARGGLRSGLRELTSHNHHEYCEYLLDVGVGGYVAEPYRSHAADGVVERGYVDCGYVFALNSVVQVQLIVQIITQCLKNHIDNQLIYISNITMVFRGSHFII